MIKYKMNFNFNVCSEDFEYVFREILEFEKKIEYYSIKRQKTIYTESKFSFNIEEDEWEGILLIDNGEGD